MEEELGEMFGRLKPLCLELIQEPSTDKVAEMRKIVGRLQPAILALFQPYLLHPFRVILSQPKPLCETMLQHMTAVMMTLLSSGPTKTQEEFMDLFDLLTMKLADPRDAGRVAVQSEENKVALVEVLELLLEKAPFSMVEHLLQHRSNLHRVGHAVSLLLTLAEKESSVKLRVASLDCLLTLSQADKPYCKKVRSQLGGTLSFCLPGIAQSLTRILISNTKQPVLCRALQVFTELLTLTLADDLLELSYKETPKGADKAGEVPGKPEAGAAGDARLQGLVNHRSPEWVSKTAGRLAVLLERLLALSSHSQWKVRLALVAFAHSLLQQCSGSLKECVPTLLQMLVSLIADDYKQVSLKAREALAWYRSSPQDLRHQGRLRQVLEDSLLAQVTALPRLVAFSDDTTAVRAADTLAGYLAMMGPQMNAMLRSATHLKRLSMALLQVLEVDSSSLHIMETPRLLPGLEKGDVDLGQETAHVDRPRRNFCHFTDQKVLAALLRVVHLLGYYGDLELLVDHFLDLFRVSPLRHGSAILILNQLLQGPTVYCPPETPKEGGFGHTKCYNDSETILNLVSVLVETYVDWLEEDPIQEFSAREGRWDTSSLDSSDDLPQWSVCSDLEERWRVLPPQSSSPSPSLVPASQIRPSLARAHASLTLQTLLMEGLGSLAVVAGPAFDQHLLRVLYPLLVRLGHEAQLLSHTAFLALADMALACLQPSVGGLLMENVDYLVEAVSARLRHLPAHLEAPSVLHLTLAYCGQSSLPLLQPLLTQVLDCFENHHTDHTEYPLIFAKVLRRILQTFTGWAAKSAEMAQPEEEPKAETETEDVVEYLRDLQKTMETSDQFDQDHKLPEEDNAADEEEGEVEIGSGKSAAEKFFTKYHKELSENGIDREGMDEEDEDGKAEGRDPCRKIMVDQTREILLRCQHLLLTGNRELTLAVLSILQDGCLLLQDTRETVWQTCHQLWQPLVTLFRREIPIVQQQVFQVIRVMVEVCGDFLRTRFVEEILPPVLRTLDRAAANHLARAPPSTLNFLQLLLSSLGPLVCKLQLGHAQLEKIGGACVNILIHSENSAIVAACREAVDRLAALDGDLLWYLGVGGGLALGGEGGSTTSSFPGPPFVQHSLAPCMCPLHKTRPPRPPQTARAGGAARARRGGGRRGESQLELCSLVKSAKQGSVLLSLP